MKWNKFVLLGSDRFKRGRKQVKIKVEYIDTPKQYFRWIKRKK